MRRLPLLTLALLSTALLGGCNLFSRGDDPDVSEVPAGDPVPAVVSDAPSEGEGLPEPGESSFDDPVVPDPNAVTVVPADLIQPTNANERVIGVQRSRPDPFASLPIPPTPPEPVVPPAATGTRAQPSSTPTVSANNSPSRSGAADASGARPSSTPTVSRPAGASSGGSAGASSGTSSAGASAGAAATPSRSPVTPTVDVATPTVALPPVPQPDTARTVRISGVVQIGGTPYAIVQTPGEVERYVRAGERIAGGSVLVKRIDTRSVEPRVILEENGLEVVANVTGGSAGVAELPEPPGTPQAALVSSTGTLVVPGR